MLQGEMFHWDVSISVSIRIIKMFLRRVFVVIIFSVFKPRASRVPIVQITSQ